MSTTLLRNPARIILLATVVFATFGSFAAASSPPAASPAAESELICHTDNPADCYPKVFTPTEEFQIVHDDQDLPPGLHVQLDVQTGQKRAKLYNPNEDNPALAGLPVEEEVIVVGPEIQPGEPRIPAGAPGYEPIGLVKGPVEPNEDFTDALQTIKKASEPGQSIEPSALDGALQLLDELSHDMYYGLRISEDVEAVQLLFCLMFEGDKVEGANRPLTERTDFMAYEILSSTVRNNPPALNAIEKSWDTISGKQCGPHGNSIKQELLGRLTPVSEPGTEDEPKEIENMRFSLKVIGELLKSPKIKAEFLENNGMQSFLQTLLRDGNDWEAMRATVARIVSDIFLDEDLGATVGIWPRTKQADAAQCTKNGSPSLGDECWEYHLRKISQSSKAPEWSKHLLALIQRTQVADSDSKTPSKHSEL
jgi:nucleotide exchange factor SIL1